MNGVRRFLGGGGTGSASSTPTTQSQPLPPTSPPLSSSPPLPPIPPTAPLAIGSKPSWPPSPLQSPVQSLPDSPKTTTAALFFRKDRQRPPPSHNSSVSAGTSPEDDVGNTSMSSQSMSTASRDSGMGSPRSLLSSPIAGPSSPRGPLPQRVSELARKPIASESRRASGIYNTKDDLLLGLLASEAVVDSRGCEILNAEEVEELKKEYQVLSSRLLAMSKKLSLETKIRDAALSLSKANASYKSVSKATSEQLDAANRKVDVAQKELWRVSERANEIQKRLLEHRAGVLSYSIRSMEREASPNPYSLLPLPASNGDSSTSGSSTPARSSLASPTSSVTSVQTSTSKRFEHFVAGHAETVVPRVPRAPPTLQEMQALEEKARAVEAALDEARAKQTEATRDLSMLKLEKEQVETSLGMDLQAAEDTISALEHDIGRLEEREAQLRALEEEREDWLQDRAELDDKRRQVDLLERRLEVLEERSGEATEMEEALARARAERDALLAEKERELEEVRRAWDTDRATWNVERATLQDGGDSQSQLDELSDMLHEIMRNHNVPLFDGHTSPPALLTSIQKHLEDVHSKLDDHERAQAEWIATKAKMEDDLRAGLDKRASLMAEIQEARTSRDEAKAQVRQLESQVKEQKTMSVSSSPVPPLPSSPPPAVPAFALDDSKVASILQPIWAILPSAEARASKLGNRGIRAGTPGSPVTSSRGGSSLSEMDVRSLKALYDPKNAVLAGSDQPFSLEGFAARVQSLVADDRALIERLIRFAQAHDLLKKNAERAQKLALDSNAALETYQKQVKTLEGRNMSMITKQTTLQDEVQRLQETVERVRAEKLEIETHAAEQAETCRQLTDANNTLSANALTLASDAASASDSMRKQLETQLAECNASLAKANEEIEQLRSSQQTQQMALLEELNAVQTENTNLRAQLRKK
ncbi:hypothetical protein CERSUDRAFT_91132 [Gelatoporia subvermispora B]|uniref:Up-regulated during septation protein 1 domain-containing protein n=1 Tax=Ceriporiopsis subvermispora (strain B) TaxID=914234 RepID=M2R7M2_CERS8|nr:hypothetical protein CERSUDRAFT_91132 [Gelatoporia subvermispora B]